MAEILKIEQTSAKIGTDDGRVINIPIGYFGYPNPRVGDIVSIYKDGNGYIVTKQGGNVAYATNYPKSINKHVYVWVCSFIFGYLGVDRFVRGQIFLGIMKLLFNWATCGIWWLVDWIIGMVKAYGSAFGSEDNLGFNTNGSFVR
ncbi:TM2 domain-containing protein [Butyrivibrio sp. NC2007]|uniref:TM2 domain-containing protein n=1 Tax=Butyrivibrio sp. NC2007 TaxID=1280683 RepID=UPI0003B7A212|nr:NINE protein [Butyrivibrio sp. NC2007]